MTGKQIYELESAASFNEGDLMLVRKSAQGVDRKINYADFIESIGNSAIDGYIAAAETNQDNKIVLTAANNAPVYKYYNGMKISFVSPIKSTGVVQVKIGNLPYKELHAYKTTSSVVLDNSDYVEAVLIGDSFQQVNNAQYVYTNDYKIVLIEPNLTAGYTDIFLESAYGVAKSAYYQGMTVNFLCTEDTSGLTRISVDGLPAKDMLENSGDYIDMIYTPLYKGQIVRLIYDGQSFIKDRFNTGDPKIIIPIEPNPDIPNQPIIPIQNNFEYNVGTALSCKFNTLRQAIEVLFKEYGRDGGGRKVTLNILSDLTITKDSVNLSSGDFSWITLKGDTQNKIKIIDDETVSTKNHWFFIISNSKGFFNFAKDTVITFDMKQRGSSFLVATNSTTIIKDITINTLNPGNGDKLFFIQGGNTVSLDNVILNGASMHIMLFGAKSILSLAGCKFNNYLTNNILIASTNSELSIVNCDLSKNGTSTETDIKIQYYNAITQVNSKAKSNYAKDTNDNTCRYSVTGSQDVQGA
ncbi:hypothetical protein Trichorick_01377 (plasmid) [Candidatus Trichorickettsia mobilis]|uniref:Uncharacterized protein n=1 Tax=Candidatus Trichorickettsia mobilis TaxID=1346319 RepID=A0ABZ0UX06_9RICK|nr:hypothetical protein [Candidatus Trichorickettsia mobilis]WPY01464.1 hypothetical protein Trichorick_01377 [Candidatus Trichorickettsia mobilis]